MDKNPLQEIIDRLFSKLDDPKISNKSYANLMYIAFESRAGLLEDGGLPENDWWANESIEKFTEFIVKANYKVQKRVNPDITMSSESVQLEEALTEVRKQIKNRK